MEVRLHYAQPEKISFCNSSFSSSCRPKIIDNGRLLELQRRPIPASRNVKSSHKRIAFRRLKNDRKTNHMLSIVWKCYILMNKRHGWVISRQKVEFADTERIASCDWGFETWTDDNEACTTTMAVNDDRRTWDRQAFNTGSTTYAVMKIPSS